MALSRRDFGFGVAAAALVPVAVKAQAAQSDLDKQLTAFLAILQTHRDQLTQQLEDIRVTLEEIEQHEERARALLAEAGHGDAAP